MGPPKKKEWETKNPRKKRKKAEIAGERLKKGSRKKGPKFQISKCPQKKDKLKEEKLMEGPTGHPFAPKKKKKKKKSLHTFHKQAESVEEWGKGLPSRSKRLKKKPRKGEKRVMEGLLWTPIVPNRK